MAAVPRFTHLDLVPEPSTGQVVTFASGVGYMFADPDGGDLLDGSVTNAKLADMPAQTLKGRGEGAGAGTPQDLTLGSSLSMSGTVLSMIIENRTDDPASPASGQVWLRTDL